MNIKDARVNFIVDTPTLNSWRDAAAQSGLSLSAWIRMRCSGQPVVVVREPGRAA